MKLTLRLLTTICYFLPFTFFLTTCNNLEIKFSYNQAEADKNIALQEKEAKVEYSDSAVQYVNDSLRSSLIEDTLQDSSKKVVSNSTINGLNSSSNFSQRLSKFSDRIFFK
jgi:hypothetical protein